MSPKVVSNRPAETGGVTFAIAVLIARLLGVEDPDILVALAVVVGFTPAAITWLVNTVRRG